MVERRIFISSESAFPPGDPREAFRAELLKKIRAKGYSPQQFGESGLPQNLVWSFANVDWVMRRCVGAVVMGCAPWGPRSPGGAGFHQTSVDRHYEGAVAVTHGLPLLLLKDSNVVFSGVLAAGGGKLITDIPRGIDSAQFTERFDGWLQEVMAHRDIFLGYCSKSSGLGAQVQLRLQDLGATVKNWEMDFRSGQSILAEIEAARASCSAGVFLFSEDDVYDDVESTAAPRDNVIFEVGYFISAKGPDRCLIVRVGKPKIPADLGGTIYVQLDKGASVASIEGRLAHFVAHNL